MKRHIFTVVRWVNCELGSAVGWVNLTIMKKCIYAMNSDKIVIILMRITQHLPIQIYGGFMIGVYDDLAIMDK